MGWTEIQRTFCILFLSFGVIVIGEDNHPCSIGTRSVWICLISEMQQQMKSVHIFYSLHNRDLLNQVTNILDAQGVKYDHSYDDFRLKRSIRTSLTNSRSYSSHDDIEDHMNFIVICDTLCIHSILSMAQDTDAEYGYSILLRHYSKWLIVAGDTTETGNKILTTTAHDRKFNLRQTVLLYNQTIREESTNIGTYSKKTTTNIKTDEKNETRLPSNATEPDRMLLFNNITLFMDNIVVVRRNTEDELKHISTLVISPTGRELTTIQLGKDEAFPNVKFGMNGREFTVVTMEWVPFTIERLHEGELDFVGISRDMLDALARSFNFTFIFPPDMAWGTMDEEGNWDGIIEMLHKGEMKQEPLHMLSRLRAKLTLAITKLNGTEADMCIAPYALNEDRSRVLSYGYLFNYEDGIVVYKTPKSPTKSLMLLASAFKYEVYLCVSAVMLVTACLLLFTRWSEFIEYDSERWMTSNNIADSLVSVVRITLYQAIEFVPPTYSSRVLLCFLSLYSMIMAAVYRGNLMAALAVSVEGIPFSTLQELAATTEYRIDVVGGTGIEVVLQSSNVSLFKEIWQKVSTRRQGEIKLNSLEHLEYQSQKVFEGGYALITPYKIGNEIMKRKCDVRTMRENVFPSYSGFIFPPESPLARIFTDSTRTMVDTGLVDKWEKKWNSPSKTCATLKTVTKRSIGVSEISSIAVAAGTGVCIGILVLLCERRTCTCQAK